MRLVLQLVARLLLIVALCLGAAPSGPRSTPIAASTGRPRPRRERVAQALQALYWHEFLSRSSRTREQLLPVPEWRTLGDDEADLARRLRRVPAGHRIRKAALRPERGARQGAAALVHRDRAHLPRQPRRSDKARQSPRGSRRNGRRDAGSEAAISLAWEYSSTWSMSRFLMAAAIALLASLAIAHALAPARTIVAASQRMARGQYRTKLPRFRSMELAMIGSAVGELGGRLEEATEQRAALTRRLIEIRDDERRALARELHDEFGQISPPSSPSPTRSRPRARRRARTTQSRRTRA